MSLRYAVLLLSVTALAGCNSRQASVSEQSAAVVASFYTQVVARHPVGIPSDADMQAFSPYLSESLRRQIDSAAACSKDWYALHLGSDSKPEISWSWLALFAGNSYPDDTRKAPDGFEITKSEVQQDGSVRVLLRLKKTKTSTAPWEKGPSTYTSTAPVAVILRREHHRDVVEDVVYLAHHERWTDDHQRETYSTEDGRLSQYLSVGCGSPAQLVQSVYTRVIASAQSHSPADGEWRAFRPYLSEALLQKVDTAMACSGDWQRQNPYPPMKVVPPSTDSFLADGDLRGLSASGFELQRAMVESRGLRIFVDLHEPPGTVRSRVAPVVIQEKGRSVIDDVVYVNDSDYEGVPEPKPPDRHLSGYLAAGCNGAHWIKDSLPKEPADLMKSFYTQIVARAPGGVPFGEDWKVFAPYFSRALLRKIDTQNACMADYDRQNPEDPKNPVKPPGLYESGLFSGPDELTGPRSFEVEGVTKERNGATRVGVTLHWSEPGDSLTWHVAEILVREDSRYVLDDVVFLKDKKLNISADYTLTKLLQMQGECAGRRWAGYRSQK